MWWLCGIVFGYLLGSIPFAEITGKMVKGVDIRKVGTKNPGAANVSREIGRTWGILVWLFDAGKGVLAIFIIAKLTNTFPVPFGSPISPPSVIPLLTLIGISAISGHCWSIFLHFQGGKGAATSSGIILYLIPKLFPLLLLLYFFIQKKGPRSPRLLISAVLIFFLFTFLLYRQAFWWLTISILLLIGIGALVNKETIAEMRQR